MRKWLRKWLGIEGPVPQVAVQGQDVGVSSTPITSSARAQQRLDRLYLAQRGLDPESPKALNIASEIRLLQRVKLLHEEEG